ncbi:hypothetical protein ILYODFUR_000331 [Ilyodon furcidens]|uniref:Spermatogenesis-associated protein 48 n=1 Tax=Ilyodon furcidens TaxID=33524 RepID=A0ABV0URG6_9TELE
MAAVLDPFKYFSTEMQVVKRLNSYLCRAGRRNDPGPGCVSSQQYVALAPLRGEVPLLDPCRGQLSAGAKEQLGIQGRPEFTDLPQVASSWRPPQGFRKRPQTAPNPSGSAVPINIQLEPQRTTAKAVTHNRLPDKHPGHLETSSSDQSLWSVDSAAVHRYIYTSATQRSYEEVNWSFKFPGYLNAADVTLERLADPVSDRASARRYNSRPQLWQSVGAEWNRRQLRSRNDAKKPISFCSRYARSGQIPSFTGIIGSENMDNIDNLDEDFQPLTVKRSIIPSYTLTANRTTIPGYTGKGVYASPAAPPAANDTTVSGVTRRSVRAAPLSRMVTTVTPCNPYLSAQLPPSRANPRRDVSLVKMGKF